MVRRSHKSTSAHSTVLGRETFRLIFFLQFNLFATQIYQQPPMGKIYDHRTEKRDNLVRAVIKELETEGQDSRKVLEELRAESEYIDGYLNDHPIESTKGEASATH
jgi:hypothetical protein